MTKLPAPEPRPTVIKLGGRALEGEHAARELAREIAALRGGAVIVHGGGAEVSAWSERLGLAPSFVNGLRVTDDATLEVAAAVLAGLANKRLVATLRAAGLDAVGLAALDGGMVEVRLHRDAAALGAVGEVSAVFPHLLEVLLAEGRVPVLASIGSLGGALLNLNADDLASALAASLHATALVLFSDVAGVTLAGRVESRIGRDRLDRVLRHPQVKDGMVAKLAAARTALDAGVARVHIARWSGPGTLEALLEGGGPGTLLAAAPDSATLPSPEAVHD